MKHMIAAEKFLKQKQLLKRKNSKQGGTGFTLIANN